jgi:hypothetical protein
MDCGLSIICSWTWVRKLAVNRFAEMGIIIAGPDHSFNLIYQCYIGVTPDGKSKAPNLKSGIQIMDANWNFISWPDTTFTTFANVIGGNGEAGIEVIGVGSSVNYVGPNCIGTDLSRTRDLGNTGDGISIKDGAADNAIMNFDFPKFIVIRNNKLAGIRVSGAATVRNLLAAGSITRNGGPGIILEGGGNGTMQSPSITDVREGEIDANAPPKSLVLFFRDTDDEGEEYIGQAYADPAGNVVYTGPVRGPYVTALAVDTTTGTGKNNTSAFSAAFHFANWIDVTNTLDSGPGSLRNAIEMANSQPGPDSIRFAIPKTDPGFTPQLGTWTIKPVTSLPPIMDRETIIDGFSQSAFVGSDANPLGPEIELEGSLLQGQDGLYVSFKAPGTVIEGLVINRFSQAGILIDRADSVRVTGCYIGTDARGLQSAANGTGIYVLRRCQHTYIGDSQTHPGNLISGNTNSGIQIRDTSNDNRVNRNTIGLDRTRTKELGNGYDGIYIQLGSIRAVISDNWIGGNKHGIEVGEGSHSCIIEENMIGTDTSCRVDLGNQFCGVHISASQNATIRGNRVAFNGYYGIEIYGPSALYNRITHNWICHHQMPGIENPLGGNAGYSSPTIQSLTAGVLSGTAQAYDQIEVFSDSVDEGEFFLGSTTADAAGNWTLAQMAHPGRRYITATAMDAKGNTSVFSTPFDYIAAGVPEVEQGVPTRFALEQNYPNPFNPTTGVRFQVSGVSDVKIAVYNLLGQEVALLVNERKAAGKYHATFDGSGLASGVYVYRMTAGTFVQSKSMLLIK